MKFMQSPFTPTDETLREIREHGSLRYPIEFYRNIYNDIDMTATSLHWHREYELVYITSGMLNCQICCNNFSLQAGQALWIAPGILHGYEFDPNTMQILSYSFRICLLLKTVCCLSVLSSRCAP